MLAPGLYAPTPGWLATQRHKTLQAQGTRNYRLHSDTWHSPSTSQTCTYWCCTYMHVLVLYIRARTGVVHTCAYWCCTYVHVLVLCIRARTGVVHTRYARSGGHCWHTSLYCSACARRASAPLPRTRLCLYPGAAGWACDDAELSPRADLQTRRHGAWRAFDTPHGGSGPGCALYWTADWTGLHAPA